MKQFIRTTTEAEVPVPDVDLRSENSLESAILNRTSSYLVGVVSGTYLAPRMRRDEQYVHLMDLDSRFE